jgi:hypothetical protein
LLVRYERLVIEAEDNNFSVEFHPRLTVIAGVGRLEREGLINELVGALGSSRSGVHAELATDSGGRFAVFRPTGGRHRVIDVEQAEDITRFFANGEGQIDVLARAGLDSRSARRRMRVTPGDLTTSSQTDQIIRRLALLDPTELWSAAERVRITEDQLQAEAESMHANPEDAEVVQRIEDRHHEFMVAQSRHELFRKLSFFCGAFAALAAVPMSLYFGKVSAMPLVFAAAAITVMSFRQFKQLEQAGHDETKALKAAGAQSYLGFHLQRVNGLLASDQHRKRLMRAAEEHRGSTEAWKHLVGDLDVTWVLARREAIDSAARTRQALTTRTASVDHPALDDAATADLAQALIARLADVRSLGAGGESFPLLLDDPLRDLPRPLKPALLELLVRSSASQQLIYFTEDPDVSSWARVEALTGELNVLEPARPTERTDIAAAQIAV